MQDVRSTKWFKVMVAVLMAATVGLAIAAMPHTAFAADSQASITVNLQEDGDIVDSATVTYDQLSAAKLIKSTPQGYLYCKSNIWNVVGTNSYVTIADLFDAAGFSADWTAASDTAYLAFTCTDGPYTKSYPTKGEINAPQYFYGSTEASTTDVTGKTPVGAVIAYSTNNTQISATDFDLDTASEVLSTVLSGGTTAPRFLIGLDDSTYNSSDAMGKRYPSNVTEITIVL